jgi:hypothetical protein
MRLLRTAAGEFINAAAIVRLRRDGTEWLAILAGGGEMLLAPYYSAAGRIERDFPHLVPGPAPEAAMPATTCQAEACCAP